MFLNKWIQLWSGINYACISSSRGSEGGCRVSDGKHSPAGFGSGSGDLMCLYFKEINRASLNCEYANIFNICVKRFVLACTRRRKPKF